MKHALKATHAAFLVPLDTELLSLGAEKYVHCEACPKTNGRKISVPGYRFETHHGTLELRPDIPWQLSTGQRLPYDLTVFGRFPDAQRAAESLGHWKWNHHFGYRLPEEIEGCVTYLVQRLLPMLVPSPATL